MTSDFDTFVLAYGHRGDHLISTALEKKIERKLSEYMLPYNICMYIGILFLANKIVSPIPAKSGRDELFWKKNDVLIANNSKIIIEDIGLKESVSSLQELLEILNIDIARYMSSIDQVWDILSSGDKQNLKHFAKYWNRRYQPYKSYLSAHYPAHEKRAYHSCVEK